MNSQSLTTVDQIFAACDRAISLAPAEWPTALPPSKELLGAPEWYSFEHEAWPIGESVRLALVKYPKIRKPPVFAKITSVATSRNLRRGRQSFIMALGYVAAHECAPHLISFLGDTDVEGQVVYTLLKMRARGYAANVAPLVNSEHAWIRRLAKKYITQYPF